MNLLPRNNLMIGPPDAQRSPMSHLLEDRIEPLVIWSAEKGLQAIPEKDRVRCADVSVKRLGILEDLDQLKMTSPLS
jgi:hypothetical protein